MSESERLIFFNKKTKKKEIVQAAVRENSKSLKFASADLKSDRQVALMALTSDVSVALKSV